MTMNKKIKQKHYEYLEKKYREYSSLDNQRRRLSGKRNEQILRSMETLRGEVKLYLDSNRDIQNYTLELMEITHSRIMTLDEFTSFQFFSNDLYRVVFQLKQELNEPEEIVEE